MAILRCIFSGTKVDAHGERILREKLEWMASEIKASDMVAAFGVRHDKTIPPRGKIVNAWVEPDPSSEGDFILYGEIELFEKKGEISLPDGKVGIVYSCKNDLRPFRECFREIPKYLTISYDPLEFESRDDFNAAINEIKGVMDIDEEPLLHKAEIPVSVIIVTFTLSVLDVLGPSITRFGEKIADKVGDKLGNEVAEDLSTFYSNIKSIVSCFIRHKVLCERKTTLLLRFPGTPIVEFGSKLSNPELIVGAVSEEQIVRALTKVENFCNLYKASKIQFLLCEEGKWKLNFLLCENGEVIGKEESFEGWPKFNSPQDFLGSGISLSGTRAKKQFNYSRKADDNKLRRKNMTRRIFISHSHKDEQLVGLLVDLLQTSLAGIRSGDIMCTSLPGYRLHPGAPTSTTLKQEIKGCEVLIGVITKNSLNSSYVLFELGAAWLADKDPIGLLGPGKEFGDLPAVLSETNGIRTYERHDLESLIDHLASTLNVDKEATALISSKINNLLNYREPEQNQNPQ